MHWPHLDNKQEWVDLQRNAVYTVIFHNLWRSSPSKVKWVAMSVIFNEEVSLVVLEIYRRFNKY